MADDTVVTQSVAGETDTAKDDAKTAAAPKQKPAAPADPQADFLASVQTFLERRGVGPRVQVKLLKVDTDGRGGQVILYGPDQAEVRFAQTELLIQDEGGWSFVANGRDPDQELFQSILHRETLTPLA